MRRKEAHNLWRGVGMFVRPRQMKHSCTRVNSWRSTCFCEENIEASTLSHCLPLSSLFDALPASSSIGPTSLAFSLFSFVFPSFDLLPSSSPQSQHSSLSFGFLLFLLVPLPLLHSFSCFRLFFTFLLTAPGLLFRKPDNHKAWVRLHLSRKKLLTLIRLTYLLKTYDTCVS